MAKVEGLETLCDELMAKVGESYSIYSVQTDIPAPPSFLPYLRANIHRFYERQGPPMTFGSLSEINIPAMANLLIPGMESDIGAMEAFIDEFTKNGGKLDFHQGEIWRV